MPGPYSVVTVPELVLRKRDGANVSVLIRAPRVQADRDRQRPMVVFSHGAGGDCRAFSDLCTYWASLGYIVVNPTHADSVRLRREHGETLRLGEDIRTQVVRGVNLMDRAADIQKVLNSAESIEAALRRQETQAAINPKQLALAGHSAGALTTQLMAGVRFYLPGRRAPLSMPEARFSAYILISGQGLSRPAFRKDSWKDITRPMMVIAGSDDRSPVNDETPEGRTHPYRYAPAGGKYLVFIQGATHSSYAGKRTSALLGDTPSASITYITQVVASCTAAFLDAHLLSDRAAHQWLQSSKPSRIPGGQLEYAHK